MALFTYMIRRYDFVHINLHNTLFTLKSAWLCSHTWFINMNLSTYIYTTHSPHIKGHVFVHIHDSSTWLCPHTFTQDTHHIHTRMALFTYMIRRYDFVHIHLHNTLFQVHSFKRACLCSHTWFLDMTLFTYMNRLYMNSRGSLHRKSKWMFLSQHCLTTIQSAWRAKSQRMALFTNMNSLKGFNHTHE